MRTPFWILPALGLVIWITPGFAQPPTAGATFIDSNKVSAAFTQGMPLLEYSEFKVHASRREVPGVAEIHTRDTDIIHVLEGSATLVTGGIAVEPKTIAPDEIRGKEIRGGEIRRIGKGDVIIVPNGVPHWFKQVDPPLLYYVVKVTSAK
jgi:mannose-6-phosphate isomerase-like protein (cupin superfamily)